MTLLYETDFGPTKVLCYRPGNPYGKGKLSTVDLHVLISWE
jgi:hypothetical protein